MTAGLMRPVVPLADFAIVTPLVEECKNLLAELTRVGGKVDQFQEASRSYWRVRLRRSRHVNQDLEIILTFLKSMGQVDSGLATYRLIERWNPARVILTGIAGGLGKDVHLGDVVVSKRIFYYDLGKETASGLQIRHEEYGAAEDLFTRADAWNSAPAGKKNPRKIWQDRALEINNPYNLDKIPRLHVGLVATGSLVVASTVKKEELLVEHPQLLATEMEAAGVMAACEFGGHATPAVIIRGISDLADENKDNLERGSFNWREIAKNNAAAFVALFVKYESVPALGIDTFELDLTMDLSAEHLKYFTVRDEGCLLCFPKFVMPRGALRGLEIRAEAETSSGKEMVHPEWTVLYTNRYGNSRVERVMNEEAIAIEDDVVPCPVGLYIRILGNVQRVKFRAETPNSAQVVTWTPPTERTP